MRKVLKTKALAFMLVSALVLPLLPVFSPIALAADHTYYIDYGNITVAKNSGDASMLDVTYYAAPGASSASTDNIAAADDIVIAQTNDSTGNVIAVVSGKVHMMLDRVNITNQNSCPLTISTGADLYLTLSGANSLDAVETNNYIPGVWVPNGASLTIEKKTSDTNDSLYARGGGYSAGIGSGRSQVHGKITINGGTIEAYSNTGAGIGGSVGGTVIINSGIVNAQSYQGAGIGGSMYYPGCTVTINGGTVTAKSHGGGAGIGGGLYGAGGTLTINGGIVTAITDSTDTIVKGVGAGIGSGSHCMSDGGGYNSSTGYGKVTITGGTVVAEGGRNIIGEYANDIGPGLKSVVAGTLIIDIPEPDAVLRAGYGGRITDNGGGAYTIEATQEDYVIDGLWVDGTLVPSAAGAQTQSVVGAKESIIATFAYTANFTEPANGSLTVSSAGERITSGQIVRGGQQLAITAEPDAGYVLDSLTVNGEDVTEDYFAGYAYTVGTKGNYRTLAADKDTGTQGAQIAASFTQANTLISITQPAAITGVPNGTAKTAFALGLPAAVGMIATGGSVQADVLWDVASSAYDPGITAAQAFAVNGTMTLPDGIINPNSVALTARISVSVDAALPVPVVWQSAAADGTADLVTSTRIDLIFDTAIAGLTAEDITITDGTGSAVKGALTGGYTSWSIALDVVTAQGDVSVAVASPLGYALSGSPKTVTLHKASPPSGTAPIITTGTLASGTAGISYSQTLAATGDAPITWMVESGGLPTGLTLSGDTVLGTPTASGTFSFTVKAQNNAGSNVKALSITIAPALYTITATAGEGGSISPSGPVSVAAGANQVFTIAPDAGYTIASITVDSVEQIPSSAYTFTGISADHTIQAAFALANTDGFVFGTREKEVTSILISAEGLFKTEAVLNATPLAQADTTRQDLEALLSGKESIAAFEISVAPENAFLPPLSLRLYIGEQYNGRTVYILHRLHDNRVEQFTPTVAGGAAKITVMELSPFVILADPWIIVTAQPQDAVVPKGKAATFAISAQSESPLSYQWQKRTGPSAAWADIPGAVNPEHTTSPVTLDNSGFQYRVIIADAFYHSAVSAAATLTVVQSPDTGDHAQPMLYGGFLVLFLVLGLLLMFRKKAI